MNFYSYDGVNHQSIIEDNQELGYKWIRIKEFELFSNFKLERDFAYDGKGILHGLNLALYDPNGECIGHGHKDSTGKNEYDGVRKYYSDRTINSEYDLFECTYHEDSGLLWELYWFNFHIDPDGQESFVLWDNANDRQKLKELTGMSDDMVDYYMSSEIVPTFGEKPNKK